MSGHVVLIAESIAIDSHWHTLTEHNLHNWAHSSQPINSRALIPEPNVWNCSENHTVVWIFDRCFSLRPQLGFLIAETVRENFLQQTRSAIYIQILDCCEILQSAISTCYRWMITWRWSRFMSVLIHIVPNMIVLKIMTNLHSNVIPRTDGTGNRIFQLISLVGCAMRWD